jgi:MSHA pilin protein MshD
MSISRLWRQRGLSLIELIIFIVVMGIAAAGVLQMFNLATRSSADPVRRKQALLLAESYLEEVELARFTYCDPTDQNAASATSVAGCTDSAHQETLGQETGGGGRPFDNVSDYSANKNTQSPQQMFLNGAGQLSDVTGTALGLNGFTVTVALDTLLATAALGPSGLQVSSDTTASNLKALRITVKVVYGAGANDFVTLDGYRTRYAPNSVP